MKYPKVTLALCICILSLVIIIRWDSLFGPKRFYKLRDLYASLFQKKDYKTIEQRLSKADTLEKIGCIHALSGVQLTERTKSILKILANDKEDAVRMWLIQKLTKMPTETANYVAAILADDTNSMIRKAANSYLEKNCGAKVVQPLLQQENTEIHNQNRNNKPPK